MEGLRQLVCTSIPFDPAILSVATIAAIVGSLSIVNLLKTLAKDLLQLSIEYETVGESVQSFSVKSEFLQTELRLYSHQWR